MNERRKIGRRARLLAAVIVPAFILGSARSGGGGQITSGFSDENDVAGESLLSDETFRIDIRTITVRLTYHPDESRVEGEAFLTFTMRPGQRRPLIHFDPAVREQTIPTIRLDGEVLPFSDSSAVRIISFTGSTQKAIEFERDLTPVVEHWLEMRYTLSLPDGYPRFSTEVSDIYGHGNEEIFPTLNTPHEMARHEITFVVDGSTAYRCLGSGWVRKISDAPQTWLLDTEREVASYTVMFALLPGNDTVWEERTIAGIPVRIMAFRGGASVAEAVNRLGSWLPQITSEIGPFPMPRGLSVFLVQGGGGMEYFGGTISSVRAIEHEVFHMYYGCSAVAPTYRDSWWDEAITSWYQQTYTTVFTPPSSGYRSNMVSGRSPIAVGFDGRAYTEGAQIIEAMALQVGGRAAFTRFLSYLHANYAFQPFGTMDLVEYYRQYSGIDMRSQFVAWLYMGNDPGSLDEAWAGPPLGPPDWTPPREILEKSQKSKKTGRGELK